MGFFHSLRVLLLRPLFTLIVLGLSAIYFVVTGVQFWSTIYLQRNFNASVVIVNGLFVVVAGTGPIWGVFFGGALIDRAGASGLDDDNKSDLFTQDMLHYGLQHLMAQTDDDELTPLTADHVAALLNRQSHGITYKAGNAAAVTSSDGRPAIIVHCVDTSGAWTSRGLFGALSRRSLSVEEAYACMRPNQDLKLGQAHCIPIDSNTFVCLLVVQSYLHQRQKRTHKTLSLRLNALQVAL
ncbi:hypothetical protein DYB36_013591, partial [Aphanomyces astaci]